MRYLFLDKMYFNSEDSFSTTCDATTNLNSNFVSNTHVSTQPSIVAASITSNSLPTSRAKSNSQSRAAKRKGKIKSCENIPNTKLMRIESTITRPECQSLKLADIEADNDTFTKIGQNPQVGLDKHNIHSKTGMKYNHNHNNPRNNTNLLSLDQYFERNNSNLITSNQYDVGSSNILPAVFASASSKETNMLCLNQNVHRSTSNLLGFSPYFENSNISPSYVSSSSNNTNLVISSPHVNTNNSNCLGVHQYVGNSNFLQPQALSTTRDTNILCSDQYVNTNTPNLLGSNQYLGSSNLLPSHESSTAVSSSSFVRKNDCYFPSTSNLMLSKSGSILDNANDPIRNATNSIGLSTSEIEPMLAEVKNKNASSLIDGSANFSLAKVMDISALESSDKWFLEDNIYSNRSTSNTEPTYEYSDGTKSVKDNLKQYINSTLILKAMCEDFEVDANGQPQKTDSKEQEYEGLGKFFRVGQQKIESPDKNLISNKRYSTSMVSSDKSIKVGYTSTDHDETQSLIKQLKEQLEQNGVQNQNEKETDQLRIRLIDALEKNLENEKKILQLSDENQNWFTSYCNQQQQIQSLTEKLNEANDKLSQMLAMSMEKEQQKTINAANCETGNAMTKYDALKQAMMPSLSDGKTFAKRNIKVSGRTFNPDCPFSNYVAHAEAHFRRMSEMNPARFGNRRIDSIDIVYNPTLEAQFIAQKEEFKELNINSNEILAFHGTPVTNIDSILEHNLNKISRTAYGHGYYFSEFPHVSQAYGDLLLFRVLPGTEWLDNTSSNIPLEYHSKKVAQSNSKLHSTQISANNEFHEYGEILIIANNQQFLPYLVYNLK